MKQHFTCFVSLFVIVNPFSLFFYFLLIFLFLHVSGFIIHHSSLGGNVIRTSSSSCLFDVSRKPLVSTSKLLEMSSSGMSDTSSKLSFTAIRCIPFIYKCSKRTILWFDIIYIGFRFT